MYRIIILLIAFLIFGCREVHSQQTENKVLEYQNSKDEFTILIVRDNISKKTAKQKGLERSAQIAKKNNFKSFDILYEQDIKVQLGKTSWPSVYDYPQNLYQEEIIEKGYDRERIISGSKNNYKLQKGLKIKIKCFLTDKGMYKVCEIIKC